MSAPEIIEFAARADGRRMRRFDASGIEVTTLAHDADEGTTRTFTEALAGSAAAWAELHRRVQAAEARAVAAECRERAALSRIPPREPARLLGPGCVRFRDTSRGPELWLLSKRESGWAAFGVVVDGWDDLFRRYAVRVTDHGTDEHGAYWIVVS